MRSQRLLPRWIISLGLMVLACSWPARAQEAAGAKVGLSVRVMPPRVAVGEPVTIEGFTPPDGRSPVNLSIRKPNGTFASLVVVPAPNGEYSTAFTATEAAGEYRVTASAQKGVLPGQGSFSVELLESLDDVEDAEKEVAALKALILDILGDVSRQVDLLMDSPARDATKAKLGEALPALRQGVRDLGELRELLDPLRAMNGDPTTRPAVKPFKLKLRAWTEESLATRTRILEDLKTSRRANVLCESIERIIEGMNFASALVNLMGGPIEAVKSVAADYVASKAGALADKLRSTFGFPATEASKVAIAAGRSQVKGFFQVEKVLQVTHLKGAVKGNLMSMAFDISSFIAQQQFKKYCEKMAGKFSGSMHAEFRDVSDKPWWTYNIEFEGRLELRYAKAVTGSAVAVNGEFIGQAIRFGMTEDALRSSNPGLMAGSIRFKRQLLPQPVLLNLLTGTLTNPKGKPAEERPIEVEGKAAAVFVRPYTFFVPVEGEIIQGVLTLRKKAATKDYEAAARVVYVLFTPLSLSLLTPIAFELPFKNGDFFLTRAMGDGGLRLPVKKTPKAMIVEETIKREKGNGRVNGTYLLKLKISNPEGS